MRRMAAAGGVAALVTAAVLAAPASAQTFSRVSVGLGVGLFDGVGLGFAYDRWSFGGAYAGVSVTTGVAATPVGAYGIYSDPYYDVPAYCAGVSYGAWAGGHDWWAWDAGWGPYYEPYWRTSWYTDCILSSPAAWHAFHEARFFSRRHRWWNRYPSTFVYWRDPFWNPWGPYWQYQPVWVVAGGNWGHRGTVYVERPRSRPGVGVPSPLYRPGVGYKESPVGAGRSAVPRRTVLTGSGSGTTVRTPTGAAAPTPRDGRVRPDGLLRPSTDADERGPGTARRPTVRTGGAPAARPSAVREPIRTRPSQARPTARPTGGAAERGERAAPTVRTSPSERGRTTPSARTTPANRPTATTRATPSTRSTPTTRTPPAARTAPRSTPSTRSAPTPRSTPSARSAPTARSTPSARSAPTPRSTPSARSAPTPRSTPAARPAPGGRSRPTPKASPAPRSAPSRGSTPSARPAPTSRSTPARAPTRRPVRKPGGGPGGGGTP